MSRTIAYHRPGSIEETLLLLSTPGNTGAQRVLLGGGTVVNAGHDGGTEQRADREVVDLQALGLDTISDDGQTLNIGAMVRLQQLVDTDGVPAAIRDAAKAELPSTLRTVSTVGGTVGERSGESVLLAALLTHETEVSLRTANGDEALPLAQWLSGPTPAATVVMGVTIANSGDSAVAATGRTPADVPIVAALARRSDAGVIVALTGVATTPVVVDADDPTRDLSPPADFRGSADYRLQLAKVLTARVVAELTR